MISMMGFVGFWLVLAIVFTVGELATVELVSMVCSRFRSSTFYGGL